MSELQGTAVDRVRRALNWFDHYFIRGNSEAPSKSLYVLGVANKAVSELEARIEELEAENATFLSALASYILPVDESDADCSPDAIQVSLSDPNVLAAVRQFVMNDNGRLYPKPAQEDGE